jgi:DNA polymerase III epsilon subunit-like protein
MRYILADTETTGMKATDKVCELAWLEIDHDFNTVSSGYSLINPEMPIHYAASAVNGITDAMVADSPTIEQYMVASGFPLFGEDVVLTCHNASFDYRFLKDFMHEESKTLCTLKAARVIYPDAENHKQATLAAMLGIQVAREKAHSADGDLDVLMQLIKCLCRDADCDLDELLHIQNIPKKVTKIPFGKHKGKNLSDLPDDYVTWLLNKCDNLNPDLRASLLALR